MTTGWLTYVIYTNFQTINTTIFNVGPNNDLYILGICIDTGLKYVVVVSFCFINSAIRAVNSNVLRGWIINEIQDTNNKNVIDAKKAYALSFVHVSYNWFDFFMYMNILLSQIDMLLFETLADLIMTGILTRYYLKAKLV